MIARICLSPLRLAALLPLLPLFTGMLIAADAPPKVTPPGPPLADAEQRERDERAAAAAAAAERAAARKREGILVPVPPAPPPPPPEAPLDEDAGADGPVIVANGATVKITIKRDNAEAVIEVPANVFGEDELRDLVTRYLPKPDPNAVQLRVYSLRKMGIDLPGEVIERLIRKAAKGPEEEQAELNITFDEPNRLFLVSSWDAIHLARIDLLMNALAKETEAVRAPFMMQMPGGGPGMMGGPMIPGGPGGPGGGAGMMPARPGAQVPPGGGEGADAEMQKRMQMERDAALKQKLEQERQRDEKMRKEGRPGRDPKVGDGKLDNPPPPAHDEQF